MSVIVKRIDLWDTIKFGHYEEGDDLPCLDHGQVDRHPPIQPYHFAPDVDCWTGGGGPEAKDCTVSVIRAPHHPEKQTKAEVGGPCVFERAKIFASFWN
jgi:hypothetical protein